jgi:uncharacterized membrane protein
MSHIAGVFKSQYDANQTLSQLLEEGFNKDNISLIMSDATKGKIFAEVPESTSVAQGSTAGALWGGAIGVLIAGLTAVGSITVPGVGLLVAGPIVAILSGAGVGAAVGGVSGALISYGFSVDEANRYEEEIRLGKAVVVVHTTDEDASKVARRILREHDAILKVA